MELGDVREVVANAQDNRGCSVDSYVQRKEEFDVDILGCEPLHLLQLNAVKANTVGSLMYPYEILLVCAE